jgi:hypothetical protein
MWTVRISGQYLRPDGSPQRGYVTITPMPAFVGQTPDSTGCGAAIISQQAKIDIDPDGWVRTSLLNPNDPKLDPGDITGDTGVHRWLYLVREVFYKGATLGWTLEIPADVGNRGHIDLARTTRIDPEVIRPADWFPSHWTDPLPGVAPSSVWS